MNVDVVLGRRVRDFCLECDRENVMDSEYDVEVEPVRESGVTDSSGDIVMVMVCDAETDCEPVCVSDSVTSDENVPTDRDGDNETDREGVCVRLYEMVRLPESSLVIVSEELMVMDHDFDAERAMVSEALSVGDPVTSDVVERESVRPDRVMLGDRDMVTTSEVEGVTDSDSVLVFSSEGDRVVVDEGDADLSGEFVTVELPEIVKDSDLVCSAERPVRVVEKVVVCVVVPTEGVTMNVCVVVGVPGVFDAEGSGVIVTVAVRVPDDEGKLRECSAVADGVVEYDDVSDGSSEFVNDGVEDRSLFVISLETEEE